MSFGRKAVQSIVGVAAACSFTVLSGVAVAGGIGGAVAGAGAVEDAATEAVKQKAVEAVQEAAGTSPAAAGDKPYSIVDGKVDENTFVGWQTYRTTGCGQCHGGAGQGGAAPSLVDRLKTITQDQFNTSVLNGKNLMPPWKSNKKVVDKLDKLYAYLKARSDGALGEEKPQKQ